MYLLFYIFHFQILLESRKVHIDTFFSSHVNISYNWIGSYSSEKVKTSRNCLWINDISILKQSINLVLPVCFFLLSKCQQLLRNPFCDTIMNILIV